MSNCPSCSKKFGFMNLLKSSNPMRIKCSGCKEIIRINGFHALIAVVITLPLAFLVLAAVAKATASGGIAVAAAIFSGLVAEFVFYKLVISGKVKSNLVANEI
ncbi:hypothetical protein A3752_09820 [Oleiphilus sp. HI0081]|uniref:hypothetical protein n=1 Tax=unclassified Oleiphilus TaxID=2631174 RepID=UPI0007C276BF|nr:MULTISPECIES: hypothetical protein [unclassified Oleiphilus]KZY42040.1 hypothetical protein A3732_17100 [Oleiphilus sp. HI0050]KZY58631.1 hypothetical protein A3735_17365 [Oleiphilus sp. HI0061]KZY73739.1 hypothetical protein A3740_18285 [Oleiphilus sp. HI0068]KZY81084.1 hypothetical protein A3741_17870 [Oleiphilus sp. HI0069]KZY85681.1 hypothetical protein A3743_18675 [Oleiphilus sp. HI0072]KZZ08797.1 hypothetical protein A3749_14160 [Oleiphilus sp. HI0078]KZZ21125.1 hypothetical protein